MTQKMIKKDSKTPANLLERFQQQIKEEEEEMTYEPVCKHAKFVMQFPTVDYRTVFSGVKAKRKFDASPQATNSFTMISFFVQLNGKQYFDHLQLREIVLKILPFKNCILLFQKRTNDGPWRMQVVYVKKGEGDCPVVTAFSNAKKEICIDDFRLRFAVLKIYSPKSYLKSTMTSVLTYEFVRPKMGDCDEKKLLSELVDVLKPLRVSSRKDVLMNDLNAFTEK